MASSQPNGTPLLTGEGIAAIARPGELIDCHSDLMVDVYRRRTRGERDVLRSRHLPGLRSGGVVACVCTCGGDVPALRPLDGGDPYLSTLALLDALHADAVESEGEVVVVTGAAELVSCIERGVLGIVPAIEGASPMGGDLGRLEDLYERGIRVIGLTWNSRNELAVGLDSGDGGLTPLGVDAVKVMNKNGMIIDLAHASERTFWDVAEHSAAPLVVTHSNAKSVWDHPRNLDDSQLDKVAKSGGIVGLCVYPSFVGEQPVNLDQVLRHADYMLDRIGPECVVVGADFIDYALDEILGDLRQHGDLYPEGSFTYPVGIESAAGLATLVAGFRSRQYDDATLQRIGIGNFVRTFQRTELGH